MTPTFTEREKIEAYLGQIVLYGQSIEKALQGDDRHCPERLKELTSKARKEKLMLSYASAVLAEQYLRERLEDDHDDPYVFEEFGDDSPLHYFIREVVDYNSRHLRAD